MRHPTKHLRLFLASLVAAGLLAVIAAPASAQDTGARTPGDIIPGQYLVTFAANGAEPGPVARGLAAAHGFNVRHVYRHALRGMAIDVPAAAELQVLGALRRNPNVRSIGNDRVIGIAAETVPTGVDRINAEPGALDVNTNSPVGTGAGVRVAVVDTGLDLDHPDLAGNIILADSRTCVDGPCVLGGQDDDGHGTFVAGVIAAIDNDTDIVGVAPDVDLISVKISGPDGTAAFTDMIAGLDYVMGLGDVDVVNLSFGLRCSVCTDDSSDPTIAAFHVAIRSLVDSGTTVVVAAGNDKADAEFDVPASFDEVIAVSALSDVDGEPGGTGGAWIVPGAGKFNDDTFAKFSNFGADIDVIAPGVVIESLDLGDEDDVVDPGGTTIDLGTSFSAPHAAGVAAIFLGTGNSPGALPGTVRLALIQNGECRDGNDGMTFHGGAGCSEVWPGDPDGIAEPLVRADNVNTALAAVIDVAVTSVIPDVPVVDGFDTTVTVGITNQGTSTMASLTVTLADAPLGGAIQGSVSGPHTNVPLNPGESKTLTFDWTGLTGTGDHELTATVTGNTDDTDESNDSRTVSVSVLPEVHDVAVVEIATPKKVGADEVVDIAVTIVNEGTFEEVVMLTMTDTPEIGDPGFLTGPAGFTNGTGESSGDITLAAGSAVVVTFTWDTTGLSGNHELTATTVIAVDDDPSDDSLSVTKKVGTGGGGGGGGGGGNCNSPHTPPC